MGESSELSNLQENVIEDTVIEQSRYAYWTYFNDVLRLMNWIFDITNVISCICISSLWSSKSLGRGVNIKPCICKNTFCLFHWMFFRIHWHDLVKFKCEVSLDTNQFHITKLMLYCEIKNYVYYMKKVRHCVKHRMNIYTVCVQHHILYCTQKVLVKNIYEVS